MKHYRIGFIGASGHWNYVVQGMRKLPNTEFVAFAPSFEGEDLSALRNISFPGKPPKFYSNYLELLEIEKPDLVSITPRYDLIASISIEAAKRGIHPIAEKPVALSLEKLAELKEVVERSGVRLMTMFGIRYQPAFYTAKKLMETGTLGEPALIWGQKSYRWGNNRPEWYKSRETYGSTINWVGIHALDWARWLSGLEYREISGYHSTLVHQDFAPCQDVAGLVARMSNGAPAVFNFDFLRPVHSTTHGDDRIKIVCSRGQFEVIGREDRLHVIDAQGEHESWPLETPPEFLVDLIDELEGKGPALISQDDAFRVTEVAIKATQAADSGQIVRL
jgi:predicted dehydrogenase